MNIASSACREDTSLQGAWSLRCSLPGSWAYSSARSLPTGLNAVGSNGWSSQNHSSRESIRVPAA
jgi:hypothetical protein